MTQQKNTGRRTDIYNMFESFYFDEKYKEVIQLKSSYPDLDILNLNQEEYDQLTEILSASYIELGMYNKALKIIDKRINSLKKKKGNWNSDEMDDLTTFFQFKIIINQRNKSLINEYKIINEYIALGGQDSQLINLKSEVENLIYTRFIIINKVIFSISIIMMILILLFPKYLFNTVTSIVTSIFVVWMIVNYVFYSKIKDLLMKLLNLL